MWDSVFGGLLWFFEFLLGFFSLFVFWVGFFRFFGKGCFCSGYFWRMSWGSIFF